MATVSIDTAYTDHAQRCADFRKLPADYRKMFAVLAQGGEANTLDLEFGLMLAMRCAATCAGQSAQRTKACEVVLDLYQHVTQMSDTAPTRGDYSHARVKGLGKRGVGVDVIPPLDDRERVTSWLER